SSRRLQDQRNRPTQTRPLVALDLEPLSAGRGEQIKLRVAAGCGRPPFRAEPPALFESMQRRIQRALSDLKGVAGNLVQPLGDRVAMQRTEGYDLQDQQVQRPLKELGFVRPRHSTYTVRAGGCCQACWASGMSARDVERPNEKALGESDLVETTAT